MRPKASLVALDRTSTVRIANLPFCFANRSSQFAWEYRIAVKIYR